MVVGDWPEEKVKSQRKRLWKLFGQEMPAEDYYQCRCGNYH